MAYEHREGSGSLFPNNKGGNEKRPDYRGDVLLGGVLYEISGWKKEGQKGRWMSLAFKPKEERQSQQKAPENAPAKATTDVSDDIPW